MVAVYFRHSENGRVDGSGLQKSSRQSLFVIDKMELEEFEQGVGAVGWSEVDTATERRWSGTS